MEMKIREFGDETHPRMMAAGNMNATQTAAVAPVNWKISQMLGMKFAPRKITPITEIVIDANLKLS